MIRRNVCDLSWPPVCLPRRRIRCGPCEGRVHAQASGGLAETTVPTVTGSIAEAVVNSPLYILTLFFVLICQQRPIGGRLGVQLFRLRDASVTARLLMDIHLKNGITPS